MKDNTAQTVRPIPKTPHAMTGEAVVESLETSPHGLSQKESKARLDVFGHNMLPGAKSVGIGQVFLSQFTSPLIYVLVAAALLSLVIQEWSDAGFILAVLLINAMIGTFQEYSAQRAAVALQSLVTTHCRVIREGDAYEVDAKSLAPGDIVLIESGDKVPADLRIIDSHDLEVDESMLTGESHSVLKHGEQIMPAETFLGDRFNMVFAGTLVERGRARGVVTATGLGSELGRIAADVLGKRPPKAPLLIRMEQFTRKVAMIVGVAALLMASVSLFRGMPFTDILLLAVALAVSAIPEGLPVALTVALAIGMRRMARRNVIIRRLVAVEALGSCTFIATDKTGTLTMNQLTIRHIVFPRGETFEVTGEGAKPEGEIQLTKDKPSPESDALLKRLCLAAVLPNNGFLAHRDHSWIHHGDAVDIALLVMAHKAGIIKAEIEEVFSEEAEIPFESERLFSASLNKKGQDHYAFIKGALETLLPMCRTMATPEGDVPIDCELLESQMRKLADQGDRVLALASGKIEIAPSETFSEKHLKGMTLIGLVGMIDPLRPDAKAAVATCREAGIEVAMVTGDHPATALAIARELDLADHENHIVTGPELKTVTDAHDFNRRIRNARVFARVEPNQKLGIVQSLKDSGHFVAVSGDGANDAPALRAAHIGVAMGKSGTDVARETASLIITDDKFSSIVAGIEEGRIAYANVRKVIFLLISTGAAELVLFTLALIAGLPIPLLAVQLLWLNLVTNGIQDVALAFEPGEGNELCHPPRSPQEPIFNRLMVERAAISALVIGIVAFVFFQFLLSTGLPLDEARNGTLLLMVLFENVHVFNSRSETRSAFRHNPWRNPVLLFGTALAQLVHIGAMYTPWIKEVLNIQPVSLTLWLKLLGLAFIVLIVMEIHKAFRRRRQLL